MGILEGIIGEIATYVMGQVFKVFIDNPTQDFVKRRKIELAQSKAELNLIEELIPLFNNELKPEQSEAVVQNLKFIITKVKLSPQVFREHNYSIDRLVDYCLNSQPLPHSIEESSFHLLRNATAQVCQKAVDISGILDDWNKENWKEAFRAFDEITKKLNTQTNTLNVLINKPIIEANSFESRYKEYLDKTLKSINVKGILNFGDVASFSLEDAFIHLQLRINKQEETAATPTTLQPIFSTQEDFNIYSALQKSNMLAITGSPGSGKSTLIQFIALSAAQGRLGKDLEIAKNLVPFVFKVRSFTDFDKLPLPNQFWEVCAPELLINSSANEVLNNIFTEGRVLIIVDGLDECEIINSENPIAKSQRDKVIEWIQKLSNTYPNNYFIVTSRPAGYKSGTLSNFTELEILKLNKRQQQDFIQKWYITLETSSLLETDNKATKIENYENSDKLIHQIIQSDTLTKLADTPLILTVICVLHRYKGGRLDETKMEVFNECINLLLYDWRKAGNLQRSVIGDLSARDLRVLLRPLAWEMSVDGILEASEEYVIKIFQKHLPEINQKEERALEIIATIRDRTGVFIEKSPGRFEFSHLQFQEYLAAQAFAESDKKDSEFLIAKSKDPNWREIIPMAIAESKGSQTLFIGGLLDIKSTVLACKALSVMDSSAPELREKTISKTVEYLREDFNIDAISTLIEAGSEISSIVLIKLIAELPVISAQDHFFAVKSRNFEPQDLRDIAIFSNNAAKRCLQYYEVRINPHYNNISTIGYFNESVESGASWEALTLGMIFENQSKPTNHIEKNATENYVLLLNAFNDKRRSLGNFLWKSFMSFVKNSDLKPEAKLICAHAAWFASDADENIDSLFFFLNNFPREVYPAFQLGILNNAMKRIRQSSTVTAKNKASELWKECVAEVEKQLCEFIFSWENVWGVNIENYITPTHPNELVIHFKNTFREAINSSDLFSEEAKEYDETNVKLKASVEPPTKKQEPFEVTNFTWVQVGTVAFFGIEDSQTVEEFVQKINSLSYKPTSIRLSHMGEEIPEAEEAKEDIPHIEYENIKFTAEEDKVKEKVFCIIYVESQNSLNEKVYCYANIRADRLRAFLAKGKGNTSWNLAEYCTIILSGFGEVPIDVKTKVERDYLFSTTSLNGRIFPSLEEVT